jgi:hypothetical protein
MPHAETPLLAIPEELIPLLKHAPSIPLNLWRGVSYARAHQTEIVIVTDNTAQASTLAEYHHALTLDRTFCAFGQLFQELEIKTTEKLEGLQVQVPADIEVKKTIQQQEAYYSLFLLHVFMQYEFARKEIQDLYYTLNQDEKTEKHSDEIARDITDRFRYTITQALNDHFYYLSSLFTTKSMGQTLNEYARSVRNTPINASSFLKRLFQDLVLSIANQKQMTEQEIAAQFSCLSPTNSIADFLQQAQQRFCTATLVIYPNSGKFEYCKNAEKIAGTFELNDITPQPFPNTSLANQLHTLKTTPAPFIKEADRKQFQRLGNELKNLWAISTTIALVGFGIFFLVSNPLGWLITGIVAGAAALSLTYWGYTAIRHSQEIKKAALKLTQFQQDKTYWKAELAKIEETAPHPTIKQEIKSPEQLTIDSLLCGFWAMLIRKNQESNYHADQTMQQNTLTLYKTTKAALPSQSISIKKQLVTAFQQTLIQHLRTLPLYQSLTTADLATQLAYSEYMLADKQYKHFFTAIQRNVYNDLMTTTHHIQKQLPAPLPNIQQRLKPFQTGIVSKVVKGFFLTLGLFSLIGTIPVLIKLKSLWDSREQLRKLSIEPTQLEVLVELIGEDDANMAEEDKTSIRSTASLVFESDKTTSPDLPLSAEEEEAERDETETALTSSLVREMQRDEIEAVRTSPLVGEVATQRVAGEGYSTTARVASALVDSILSEHTASAKLPTPPIITITPPSDFGLENAASQQAATYTDDNPVMPEKEDSREPIYSA